MAVTWLHDKFASREKPACEILKPISTPTRPLLGRAIAYRNSGYWQFGLKSEHIIFARGDPDLLSCESGRGRSRYPAPSATATLYVRKAAA
jgi:hypothetical protein